MRFIDKNGRLPKLRKYCLIALIFFNCAGAANCQTDEERYDAQLEQCVVQGHKDVDSGVKCLENLLKANPHRAFIHLFLARDYRELNQLDKAEKSINAFLSAFPAYASGYEERCEILMDKKDFTGASKACVQAIELEPDKINYRQSYAKVVEEAGDFSQAEILYKQILEKNPDDESTLVSLGRLYEKMGNTDQAIETYEKLLKPDYEFKEKLMEGIERLKKKREIELNKEKESKPKRKSKAA